VSSESIGDILVALDEIIESAKRAESPLGYFPALYRRVTAAVADAIESGDFEDGARMEAFDVVFARRYLDAFQSHRQREPITASWNVCFGAATDPGPIVLQHLVLGMNAHINLDLGITAAQVAPGPALPSIERDFMRINELLASMVDAVQRDLAGVWPLLRPLDWLAGRSEERLVGFSIDKARDHSWRFAQQLSVLDGDGQEQLTGRVDRWIAAFGHHLHEPPGRIRWLQRAIRMGERGSVSEIIDLLR
jgi:hypothetical protein